MLRKMQKNAFFLCEMTAFDGFDWGNAQFDALTP